MSQNHRAELLRQFTLQAVPFSRIQAHANELSLRLFVELGDLAPHHQLLDAGCGPGILLEYLASRVARAVGFDVTPAMLAEARRRLDKSGATHIELVEGDLLRLPFADGSFDRVCTRFALHHVPEVRTAFEELVRVSRPGGRLILMDAAPPAHVRSEYDRIERIRDPSHASALTIDEMLALGESQGLGTARVHRFDLPIPLESQLAASFPEPGGADQLRALFREVPEGDGDPTGFKPRWVEGELVLSYPIATVAWTKPGNEPSI